MNEPTQEIPEGETRNQEIVNKVNELVRAVNWLLDHSEQTDERIRGIADRVMGQ